MVKTTVIGLFYDYLQVLIIRICRDQAPAFFNTAPYHSMTAPYNFILETTSVLIELGSRDVYGQVFFLQLF